MIKKIKNIFSSLKKCLNSCDDKKTKSCILKGKYLLVIFFFIIILESAMVLSFLDVSVRDFLANFMPNVLVELTNIRREEAEVDELIVDSLLIEAAQMKAEDMAQKGYFAHTSPEGITPWYWFDQVGYDYRYAGENLAVNFIDPYSIDRAWMASPLHRSNVINEKFKEIGIAQAIGIYKGRQAIFIVQLFGTKRERTPQLVTITEQDLIVTLEEEIEEEIIERELNQETGEVMGDISEEEKSENSFALIEKIKNRPTYIIGNPEEIIIEPQYFSLWARIFSSPFETIAYILFILTGLIFSLTFLKIFFLEKIDLLVLTTNGLIILVIIFLALATNHYLLCLGGSCWIN